MEKVAATFFLNKLIKCIVITINFYKKKKLPLCTLKLLKVKCVDLNKLQDLKNISSMLWKFGNVTMQEVNCRKEGRKAFRYPFSPPRDYQIQPTIIPPQGLVISNIALHGHRTLRKICCSKISLIFDQIKIHLINRWLICSGIYRGLWASGA